jgi:hypothetical protein
VDPIDGKGFAGVTDEGGVRPSGNRDYFIGTETGHEEVSQVFQDSKYFEESEGSGVKYSAPGIDVDVTGKGIEYDVDKQADDGAVTEFVHGIVRSFDDVEEEFFSEVEQAVYNSTREIIADGGTLEDVDHSSPYESEVEPEGSQESMERGIGYQDEHEKIADGGEEIMGIPLAGFPSNVERTKKKDSDNYMGSF